MRILHTADWQLGMQAAHAGAAAEKVRAARLEAAERVVELALAHNADVLVLAGDTFEDNAVPRSLVQRAADLLARFRGPVLLLPGNHDPHEPGSVWEHPSWARSPHLRVLREPSPFTLPGLDVVFFSCPLLARRGREDPTAWLRAAAPTPGLLRVGIAHGTMAGAHLSDPEFPLSLDVATQAGLDYLALGHWHSTVLYPDGPGGGTRTAYSGTHESTRFGERDSGNALLVELSAPGLAPHITPLRTGRLRWLSLEHRCLAEGSVDALRGALEAEPEPEKTLLRLRLEGVLHPRDQEALVHLGELAQTRFLSSRIESFLRPAPEAGVWLEGLPAGPLRAAASRLLDWSTEAPTTPRPEGYTAASCSLALLELYELASEGAR